MFLHKLVLKDYQKTCHWVDHSKTKPIDTGEFIKRKKSNENNPEDQDEDESDNTSDTVKSVAVFSMVVTAQGKVDIYNQHVAIHVKTDKNNKKPWKTIYK